MDHPFMCGWPHLAETIKYAVTAVDCHSVLHTYTDIFFASTHPALFASLKENWGDSPKMRLAL